MDICHVLTSSAYGGSTYDEITACIAPRAFPSQHLTTSFCCCSRCYYLIRTMVASGFLVFKYLVETVEGNPNKHFARLIALHVFQLHRTHEGHIGNTMTYSFAQLKISLTHCVSVERKDLPVYKGPKGPKHPSDCDTGTMPRFV